jgi:hypothetical protein
MDRRCHSLSFTTDIYARLPTPATQGLAVTARRCPLHGHSLPTITSSLCLFCGRPLGLATVQYLIRKLILLNANTNLSSRYLMATMSKIAYLWASGSFSGVLMLILILLIIFYYTGKKRVNKGRY